MLFRRVLSDLSLPHQVFIAKTDIWNGEIHTAAWFHSEKVSEEGSAAGPGEGGGGTTHLGLEIDPAHPPPLRAAWARPVASSRPGRAALRPSSAVISSTRGQITACSILSGGGCRTGEVAGGGASGRTEEAPLCRYVSTITFLFIYPALDLPVCTVFCLLWRFSRVFFFFLILQSCVTVEDNLDLFH